MPAAIQQKNNCYWISSARLETPLTCESFDSAKLIQAGAVSAIATGRASVWFIRLGHEPNSSHAVLRHYYRGGQIAKISADRFIWNGIKSSRAVAEYHLLEWMFERGLPTPEPLGARVIRDGVFYTCDIITREIANTQTLTSLLSGTELIAQHWQNIGKTIKLFHNQNVYHADLNANNILLDSNNNVSLIDFDRCKARPGDAWKNKNILRLKRSLDKLYQANKVAHFNNANWQSLLDGYELI